ncbi:MAG: glycosyl hydrolase 108 family protein [Brevundimonas sp.]|uniref:glycosyl hydrolase 108 family protein n=1 Tax=Brevundimonas sp. TaxID=1871086 RepID=UPI00391A6542
MARSRFPHGGDSPFGRQQTAGNVPGAAGTSAPALESLASSARALGRDLREAADRRLVQEGLTDAARDAARDPSLEGFTPRRGFDVGSRAYNEAAGRTRAAALRSQFAEEEDRNRAAHPDNPQAYAEAMAVTRQRFEQAAAVDPRLSLELGEFMTLTEAAGLGRVREVQRGRMAEAARGALRETARTARALAGQTATAAQFDDNGAALVGAALQSHARDLAHYGPTGAFELGGVRFEEDPSRLNVMSVDDLTAVQIEVENETREAWMLGALARVQGADAQMAFLTGVRELWAQGEGPLSRLSFTEFERLSGRMEREIAATASGERAERTALEARTRDLLTALEYGADVDPDELREAARLSGDVGLQAQVEYRLAYGWEVSPQERARGARGGEGGAGLPGFAGAVDFLLDRLEGGGLVPDDNGAGRSQWGITERSHPQAWADGRVTREEAAAIYRREYWEPLGLDALPPDLAVAVFSAAVVGGVGTARELLARSGGDVERFLQLEMARFERLAASDPRHARHLNGWRARQGRVRGQIANLRQSQRAAEGFSSDPLEYARGTRTRPPVMAGVVALEPGAVFSADAGERRAWAQAVAGRHAQGRELNRSHSVPARVFTNAEVAFYKDAIDADPVQALTLARTLYDQAGPEVARAALRDLGRGGVAGSDIYLATLAMNNPESETFVRGAMRGRQLRAEGASAPVFESVGRSGTRRREENIDQALRRFGAAFENIPDEMAHVRRAAEDRAIAATAAGDLRAAEWYINSALGGTTGSNGRRYGGLAEVNGRAVIAPVWAEAGAMEDIWRTLATNLASGARGPRQSNGLPIPAAELRRFSLELDADGTYLLRAPSGAVASDADGRVYRLDLEASRGWLRQQMGEAIRAGGRPAR